MADTAYYKRSFGDEEHAEKLLARASQRWVEPDKKTLSVPGVADIMSASLVQAAQQGTTGTDYEGTLTGSRNWDFSLEEIKLATLYLWQGEQDTRIPVSAVRALAKKLTICKTTYYPDEGHISLIANQSKNIIDTLAIQ